MGLTKQKQQKLKKQKKLNQSTTTPAELTFIEHIYELRKRLFWVVFIVIVGSAAGFQFKDFLIDAIMAPLHGEKLVYLTPGGGFSFIFTVSIYFGALMAIPFAIFHLYKFLQPMLGVSSKRLVALFMILSTVLAASGALFGYFVTIPAALNFLSTFAGDAVIPNLTADSYLSFVVTYILGLALIFQLPLLIFIFDHIHPFPPGTLSSTQRFVIIGATVLAAVITPTPDAINMAIVAVPIVVVYQFGALAVFIRRFKRKTQNKHVAAPVETLQSELENTFVEDIAPAMTPVANEQAPVTAEPQSALHLTASIQPRPRRSMDGMTANTSAPRSSAIVVPARQTVSPAHSHAIGRHGRSIDGFRPVKA